MGQESNPRKSIREIYLAWVEIADAEKRRDYLDQVCGNDITRRVQIEKLLAAHVIDQTNPLDKVVLQLGRAETLPSEPSSNAHLSSFGLPVIDRYKIREQIGEGGMGIVYVAEQTNPIRRKVALKVIKPGLNNKDVVARFEAERQALALMDHPNIAKVLDGATLEDGRPYFVMELVQGVTITDFCDAAKLSNRQRLLLFVEVCNAVQHAHQKGIIHRDLKPSNIMVTMNDDKPMPKVIDFGIAKALSQPLTEKSVYTAYGQLLGTPLYMSPEQAQLSAIDVDTRSDVYSLGVVLYELLTGSTPFDKTALQKSGFDEMRRLIREVDPPRPSQRVSTLKAEASTTVSARRSVDPRKLGNMLSGELDWIVMKSLEKERLRRYQSPREFADDIERYLTDRPVEACPPSIWYSVSKITKRHRTALVSASLVLTTLLAGLVATTSQVIRASIAETALRQSLVNEQQARKQADAEAVQAMRSAQRADAEASVALAVNSFLKELFELADIGNQIEAEIPPDPNVTVRTLLDRASKTIDGQFPDAPKVEASIHYTLGNAYRSIGLLDSAAMHLERAVDFARNVVGSEDPGTARAIAALAQLRTDQGQLQDAETLAREALEISTRLEGETGWDTEQHVAGLIVVLFEAGKFEEAKLLAERNLEMCRRKFGSSDNRTLGAMQNLASQLSNLGEHAEAYALVQRVLEQREIQLGPTHPNTLHSLSTLAVHLDRMGDFSRAAKIYERVLKEYRTLFGPNHPMTISKQANLGHVYTNLHKLDEALDVLEPASQIAELQFGNDNPITQTTQGFLAEVYRERKEYQKSIAMYRKLLEKRIANLSESHPKVISTRIGLASTLYDAGRVDESAQEFTNTIELAKRVLGNTHELTLVALNNSAVKMQAAGRNKEALEAFQSLLEVHQEKQGPNALDTFFAEFNVAYVHHELGQKIEALKQLESLILRMDEILEVGHPLRQTSLMRLGFVLKVNSAIADRHKRAADAYRRAFNGYLKTLGRFHSKTLEAMENYGSELIAAELVDDAEVFFKTQMEETLRQFEPTHTNSLQMKFLTGKLLLRANRAESGLPLLHGVYGTYLQQLGPDDRKTFEVLGQLIQYYETHDDLETAKTLAKDNLRALEALASPRKGSIREAEVRLVALLIKDKEYKEAENRLKGVFTRQPALFVPISVEAAETHMQLAQLFERDYRFDEAERERRAEYEIYVELFGPSHPRSISALFRLVTPLMQLEKFSEAEAALREVIKHYQTSKGTDLSNITYRNRLVKVYLAQGKFIDAEQACQANKPLIEEGEKQTLIAFIENQRNWAIAMDQQGRHTEAEQLLRKTLESLASEGLRDDSELYSAARLALVDLLWLQERHADAIPFAHANYEARMKPKATSAVQTRNAIYYLAKALFAVGQFGQAEPLLRELQSEKESFLTRPQNFFDSMSMLGDCLLVKKQYDESEPFLLEGYTGMEKGLLRATISQPERRAMYVAAADRLVRLYEATSNPTQCDHWRAVRERWASLSE